jgi:hypothetical protein
VEQPVDSRLEQVMFLHTLAEDFDRFNEMYEKARPLLMLYHKVPKKMETESEWGQVADALSDCYKSVKFLYKIAMLVKSGIIDKDLLYIFYYNEITDNITFKLSPLTKWCGTGLDSAANYNSSELARVAIILINLVEELDAIHQEHGADLSVEGDSEIIKDFQQKTGDFFSNPGGYRVDSPDYVDKFVLTRQKIK